MDKPESIFSFLAALLTAIGSFLGLLRISPDWFPAFGKSSISSINSKFEETTKLESNLEGRGESAIRLRKKGLAEVVPEKLRTLDHGRPWSDDQFASTRLSSNRDMSR